MEGREVDIYFEGGDVGVLNKDGQVCGWLAGIPNLLFEIGDERGSHFIRFYLSGPGGILAQNGKTPPVHRSVISPPYPLNSKETRWGCEMSSAFQKFVDETEAKLGTRLKTLA